MSIIMSAGGNKTNWVPKDQTMVKKAGVDDGSGAIDVIDDELYNAAKSVCQPCEKVVDVTEVAKSEPAKEEGVVAGIEKVEEALETAAEAIDTAKVALDVAEEKAVPEHAEPHAIKGDEGTEDKEDVADVVEIEITDDEEKEEKEEKTEDKKEEKDEDKGEKEEIIKESVEEKEDKKEEGKEEKEACMASTNEEFCKFAYLSPANRKKLVTYMVNMLGYPDDYVKLMVKDYEK